MILMVNIPFYENTKDDLHCVQAALKSVLKFYFPKRSYSFSYLDKITVHKKNMFTWDFAMLMFLKRLGFKVVYIVDADLKRFAKEGETYLKKTWHKKVYEVQKKYSDFKAEQKRVQKFLKSGATFIQREVKTKDIERLFNKGYSIFVSINPMKIKNKKGYSDHLVVVTDITPKTVTYHDSGLPPFPDRKVSRKVFRKALAGSLIAVRR